MKKSVVILFLALFGSTAYGQSLSFRCKFSDGQVTEFDRGSPRVNRSNDLSDLVFDQVDPIKGTARFIGNLGAGSIQVLSGMGSFHLIEITRHGNVNLTTIFYDSIKNMNQSIPVVHSRHVNTPSGPFPSQYLGLCTKLQ